LASLETKNFSLLDSKHEAMYTMQQIALTSEVPSSIMLHKVVDR